MTAKPKPPMDPNVEPPGYKPPTSAAELLERYEEGERYFEGAQLKEAMLSKATLDSANLSRADLGKADISGANLDKVRLCAADLSEAIIEGASLKWADLKDARCIDTRHFGANLHHANLQGAFLGGRDKAVFRIAGGTPNVPFRQDGQPEAGRNYQLAIDIGTSATAVVNLSSIKILDEGLTIYFNTAITPFDQFLINGVIFGVLGQQTNCHVVEFREDGDKAIVRLQAENQTDLETVADALYHRVWDAQQRAQKQALVRMGELLRVDSIGPALSRLVDGIEDIKLRLPDKEYSAEAQYEQALSSIQQMALVMEQAPGSFTTMGEEDLRQHFLVQLNAEFKGEATAESYNRQGMTDILIRKDGQNLFIAECKIWSGKKALGEAIDQLLSYTTWRDTQVALIIFNRNRAFSDVLVKMKEAVGEHPQFDRWEEYKAETGVRCILRRLDDPKREITLTVLAFDIPKGEG